MSTFRKGSFIIILVAIFVAFVFGMNCFEQFEQKADMRTMNKSAEDDFLKSWVQIGPSPISEDIYSIQYSNSVIVASLTSGKILYSDNAMLSFDTYNLPQPDLLMAMTDYNGYFVGVGSSGKIFKSSDGKSWSEISGTALNNSLNSVVAGSDRIIAVGNKGTIAYSEDLNSFSKITTVIQDNLYDIAVSDSGTYVAVGQNSVICRSENGISFSCSTSPAQGDVLSVAYGSGKFVAVSMNYKVLISEDEGKSWTVSDLGISGWISRIRYYDNFIIFGYGGLMATSTSGDNFAPVKINSGYNLRTATYDGSMIYFAGNGGLIITSYNPSSGFMKLHPEIPGSLYSLYQGKEYYLAGGSGGILGYSTDSQDWYLNEAAKMDMDIKGISSNGTLISETYCAVGTGGKIYYTSDPTSEWFASGNAGSNNFNDIIYVLNKFIAVGDGGALYISGDCKSWLNVNSNVSENLRSVASDGTGIVAAGNNGTLIYSTNPSGPYSKVNFPNSYDIVDIAYGNGMFLFLTQEKMSDYLYNSRIYKSSDLTNISLAKEYLSTKLTTVSFGGSFFLFTGNLGNFFYTKDAQNFSNVNTGKYKDIYDSKYLGSNFFVAGVDGILLRSSSGGSNLEPQISVSPSSVDFGDVVVNSSSNSEDVVVSNTGKGDLKITSVKLSGTNASMFSIITESCSSATLAENDECHIYVDFTPTSTGSKTSKLDISSNDPAHPVLSVNMSGNGVNPSSGVISTDKQSIDFGSVKINTESNVQSVEVKNVGTKDLNISSVYLDGNDADQFEIKNDECGSKTLAPNNSCTISLVFKPQSTGSKNTNLAIDSDDPNKPTAMVLLKGNGIDKDMPDIFVDKSQINFGIVKVDTESSAENLLVTNKGTSDLIISDTKISGANLADFLIKSDNCKGKTLTPSSICQISLAFKPSAEGNRSAELKISSNDPDNPEYSVELIGTGRAPGGAAINVTPMSMDFGKINTGSESAAQDIMVSSTGDSDLSITNVEIAGTDSDQFDIKANNCPLKLAPQQNCKISVSFKPSKSGKMSAIARISSNDSVLPEVDVSLSGEGVLNKPSQISVSPSSYDFGKRIINKVYPATTFTVSNTGTGNLEITSVALEGVDSSAFSIDSDDCSGNQFAPDGICYIKVSFKPDVVKTYSANMVIYSNDGTAPKYEVSLKGEGIEQAEKDGGVEYDIYIENDTGGGGALSDVKSKDESTSGCGCSMIE